MKKYTKLFMLFAVITMMILTASFWQSKVYADDTVTNSKVMTVTIKTKAQTLDIGVYMKKSSDGSYSFELENDKVNLLFKDAKDTANVSVVVNDKNAIDSDSIEYDEILTPEWIFDTTYGMEQDISFLTNTEDADYERVTLQIMPFFAEMSVDNLNLFVNPKGFHPGKDSYISVYSEITVNTSNSYMYYYDENVYLRIRVLNKKGKYVYQTKVKGAYSGTWTLHWDGKASKKNSAKVKAKKYVKDGKYKLEVALIYDGKDVSSNIEQVKATKTFKISRKTPSGSKGIKKAKKVPMMTGYANIDYLAEKMVKAAGVKSNMSDDEKVKRIYHYMTTHFHHYELGTKGKNYYNLKSYKKKIKKYKKKLDKKHKKGKVIYTYYGAGEENNLIRRGGVCDNNAAMFVILCNHVGVEAGTCGGYYLNRSGAKMPHAWSYAYIDGKVYYYDVDIEISNYKKGQGDYYWYKKTKSQAKKNHEFE